MVAKKILSKIDTVLREKSSKDVVTEYDQGAIDTLRMLRGFVEEAGKKAEVKKKREKPVKHFMVHGKAHFYDSKMKSPVSEDKILPIDAPTAEEAGKEFKKSIEATEKVQVGTQKVFTRVTIDKITDMETD